MAAIFLIIGGAIFGVLHAFYTSRDTRRPRRLAPDDLEVISSISSSRMRLSRRGTTRWRAWLGLNFSPSLGAILFCFMCIFLAFNLQRLTLLQTALLFPVVIALIYCWLATRYWFYIPAEPIEQTGRRE